ncbi:S24 family peptidase [Bacteroides fluxus]|jgi:transcriptional regulator with XRE-family HTH domain|uniref:Bacteriophage CI repressor protein n=1 Tax=Bacteroides fluxus YIT 12057 TaxID=763034 RepID=F3PV08_9BACE|nr:S24 family peptidase [Bacteroides fluxus]EGF55759.1 bacteriophage CI repressor protein [Bacteroides fluxus YIT 12057]
MIITSDSPFNAAEIVKRAKLVKDFKTDSELAAFLGISRSTLSNWTARNSIDFPLILKRFSDIDYNWLLAGKGTPMHQPVFCNSELAKGEVEIIHNPKTPECIDDRSVTLYDISAAANLKTMLADRPQYALGKILIPNVPQCDGAVYVSGDSMYPILKAGDIVGFKSISSFSDVIYGEMYLVSFERGGDEYLAVKYINRSEQAGCLKLVSYNTHHDPMDLPLQAINAMAIVKFSIRKNMMM